MRTKEEIQQDISELKKKIEELEKEPFTEMTVFEKYGIQQFPCKVGDSAYFINTRNHLVKSQVIRETNEAYNEYPTEKHAERIAKLQYLFKKALWIAEQLRDEYNFKQEGEKFKVFYEYKANQIKIAYVSWDMLCEYVHFYFQSYEKAEQFIEIMGEDDLKYLLTAGEN